MSGISFTRGDNVADEEAVMQFYDGEGKKVKKGHAAAVVQYLSNDPNRPDAKQAEKATPAADETVKAVSAPPEDKAVKSPAETK
jgi:hypothetical protein